MTKPTGRPKGAPKKYDSDDEKPITLSLRVPRELVQPLKRYAAQHRQSMSELLLDGLRWRLSEGDPRGNGLALPLAAPDADKSYYENTVEQSRLLGEVHAMLASLSEAVASGTLAAHPPYSRNTEIQESASGAVEPSEPPAPSAGATRQCRKKHPPYPASKRECPLCVALRQAKARQRQRKAAEAR